MNKKRKIVLTIFLSLVLVFSCTLLFGFNLKSKDELSALSSKEFTGLADVSVSAYKATRGNPTNKDTVISNGDFVMLRNSGKSDQDSNREIVMFNVNAKNGKALSVLDVNVTLNGENIVYNGYTETDPEDATAAVNKSLAMKLTGIASDLQYQTESLGDVLSAEGYYEFYFRVSVDSGTIYPTEPGYFYHYGVYLLNDTSYNGASQIPTLANVEDDPSVNEEEPESMRFYKKQYIYNFNAYEEDRILYPTIKFDPEKYDVKLTKTYRNSVTVISTNFKYTDNLYMAATTKTNYGILTFTYGTEGKVVSFKLARESGTNLFVFTESFEYNSSSSTNYNEPLLKDLGSYVISYKYKLYTANGFVTENKTNGNISIKSDLLTIFGYVATYAKNGSGSAEFNKYTKNGLYYELSDVTRFSADLTQIPLFVSTNQAPVWLSYYGTLVEGKYWFSVSGAPDASDEANALPYIKAQYFEQAGYYIIKVVYNLENYTGSLSPTYEQYIAFQIKNIAPSAYAQVSLTGTFEDAVNIDSNTFTSGSVRFIIEEKSTFDSDITLLYTYAADFVNNGGIRREFIPYYGDNESTYTKFVNPGAYTVEVHFGGDSYSVYSFTIDKQQLKDVIGVNGVTYEQSANNTTIFKIDESKDLKNNDYTNDSFTVYANKKQSGAPISATLRTIQVNSYDNSAIKSISLVNNDYWMPIAYRASDLSSPQTYNFIRTTAATSVLGENVFSAQKIYIFEFSDKAGYTARIIMFLDRTPAEVIQKDKNGLAVIPDSFNVVSGNTEVSWGTHKVITMQESAYKDGYRDVLSKYAPNVYVENNGLNIIIPLNQVKIEQTALDMGNTAPEYNRTVTLNQLDYSTYKTNVLPADDEDYRNAGLLYFFNQGFYLFTITDASGNVLKYSLEMNLDKSQVMCLSTSEMTNNEVDLPNFHATNRVVQNQATNRYGVFISFVNSNSTGEDIFAIESLTYNFYPYDLSEANQNSPYYPYTATPTIDAFDILSTATSYGTSENQMLTPMLKEESLSVQMTEGNNTVSTTIGATAAGKYVVTRVYKGTEAEIGAEGDEKVKTYTFFVDRNAIIQTPNFLNEDEPYIGSNIKLLLGSEQKSFTEFYRGVYIKQQIVAYQYIIGEDGELLSNKIIYKNISLKTNLVPLQIEVPGNKYSIKAGQIATVNPALKTFNLSVTVTRYEDFVLKSKDVYSTINSSGYIQIPAFTKSGYYMIEIHDQAVDPNNQITPNSGSVEYFALQISLDNPNGSYMTSKEDKPIYEAGLMNQSISSDGNIYFEWENKAAEESENVDNTSVLVYRMAKTTGSYSSPVLLTSDDYQINTVVSLKKISSIKLPGFGYNNGVLETYQYKIDYLDYASKAYSQKSLVMEDFDEFSEVTKTSTKDGIIEFTFTDPVDEYYASIDTTEGKIVVQKYAVVNGNATLVETITPIMETRLISENRRFYSIKIDAPQSATSAGQVFIYKITICYLGDSNAYKDEQGNAFYSSDISLVVDRNPPSYFLDKLAQSNIIQSTASGVTSTSSIKSYKTEDDVYYYARVGSYDFSIKADFSFVRDAAKVMRTQDQETQYFYMRQYNKYDTSISEDQYYLTYQSLVPGDSAYYDVSYLNLRFDSTNSIWTEFEYTGATFGQIVDKYFTDRNNGGNNKPTASERSGYYEIIEIDEAGNHTIYTVYYYAEEPTISISYLEQGSAYPKALLSGSEITASNSFEMVDVHFKVGQTFMGERADKMFTISLDNITYRVSPTTDMTALLSEINSSFVIGKSYHLTISTRSGTVYNANISVASDDAFLADPYFVKLTEDEYKVIFPNDIDTVKLKTVKVYRYDVQFNEWTILPIREYLSDTQFEDYSNTHQNANSATTYEFTSQYDENGVKLEVTLLREFYLTKDVYKFELTDSLRNEDKDVKFYVFNMKLGVDDRVEWAYTGHTANDPNNSSVIVTDGVVSLSLNDDIYSVVSYLNDELYVPTVDVTTEALTYSPPKNISEIVVRSGSSYTYRVLVTDRITTEVREFVFVIYNIFPAVQVTDSTGSSMLGIITLKTSSDQNNELSSFTSKSVYFDWETGLDYVYTVTLKRYENNYNNLVSTEEVTVNTLTVSQEGVYELTFTNSFLLSSRTLCFIIKDSTISMYAVYENVPNVGYKLLTPSDDLIDITNAGSGDWDRVIREFTGSTKEYPKTSVDGLKRFMVKSYFSQYTMNVEVEGDKKLITNYTDIISAENNDTNIYLISREDDPNFKSYVVIIYGSTPYSYLDVFVVTRVTTSSNIVQTLGYEYENEEGIKESFQVNYASTDYIQVYVSPVSLVWKAFYGMEQNTISIKYYFNGRYITSTKGTLDGTNRYFNMVVPGEYTFVFSDLARNSQKFGTSSANSLTVLVLSEVVYKVNDDQPIYGAVYNDTVTLAIENANRYKDLKVEVFKNGEAFTPVADKYNYTFSEVGVYKVLINADVTYGSSKTSLAEAVYVFSIINKDEARFAYEFTDLNGYEIVKVTKGGFLDSVEDYLDITDTIKSINNVVSIYNLVISEDLFGTGKYEIFVEGNQANELMNGQGFSFGVWINNEIPVINSSVPIGTSTLDEIKITYNGQSIYEQIGESKIVIYQKVGSSVMGYVYLTFDITESTLEVYDAIIKANGEFYVTLITNAGNVVSMFKVIKQEPLNTVAIIIIVISVLVVIVGTIVFVKFRLRMTVK